MNYFDTFAISAAGMNVERARVDIASLNLANANTVRPVDGGGYQALRVVARGMGVTGERLPVFASQVDKGLNMLLPRAEIETSTAEARMVYEPENPFANDKGFVAYPGVNAAAEMMTMMSAMRGYEANVAAMNTARNLALKTLEIGGGS